MIQFTSVKTSQNQNTDKNIVRKDREAAPLGGINRIFPQGETQELTNQKELDKLLRSLQNGNSIVNPLVLRRILEGKPVLLNQNECLEFVQNPAQLDRKVCSPEFVKTLYQLGEFTSDEHQAVLNELEDPKTFELLVNHSPSGRAKALRDYLHQNPLIIHDLIAHPKVLSNLYGWLAKESLKDATTVVSIFNEEVDQVNSTTNDLFGKLSPVFSKAPIPTYDNIDQLFLIREWTNKARISVVQTLMQFQNPDQAKAELLKRWEEANQPQDTFDSLTYWFSYQKAKYLISTHFDGQYARLKTHLGNLMALEVYAAQPETHFELMRLMSILSKTFSPELKAEFEKLGKSPFESFKRVFSTPPDKISNVSLLFGRSFEEISQKVAQYSKTPPAPEAFRQIINHSVQGAIWAGVFSGVVDKIFTGLNWLYVNGSKLLSNKPIEGLYRQEAWVEDIVGNKMIEKLKKMYPSPLGNDEILALHNAAKSVAQQGFFGKFITSLFVPDTYAKWLNWGVDTFWHPPKQSLYTHISTLSDKHKIYQAFIDNAKAAASNSLFTERFSNYTQWCFKLVPTKWLGLINDLIEPFLRQKDHIVNHAVVLLNNIPFLGKMIEISATNIPFKTELFSASISLAYNLITGIGNMALLDEAQQSNGTLSTLIKEDLTQANHWKVMQTYIDAVYRRIDAQTLSEVAK